MFTEQDSCLSYVDVRCTWMEESNNKGEQCEDYCDTTYHTEEDCNADETCEWVMENDVEYCNTIDGNSFLLEQQFC